MKNKHVLISGMGVAGLTLAYFLKQNGFQPTLLERAPGLRSGGYKVDIRGAALKVIQKMGMDKHLLEYQASIRRACEIDDKGDVINEIPGSVYNSLSEGDFEILRGDLCEIILDELNGVKCLFDDSIASVEQHDSHVVVTMNNKEQHQFDLLIGADGIHSNVRKLVFGDERNFIKHFGIYICIYSMKNILSLKQEELLFEEPNRFINVYNSHYPDVLRVALVFIDNKKSEIYKDRADQMNLIHKVYSEMGWRAEELLSYMKAAKDFYFDTIAQIHMPHWSDGRVALVGDAGYCGSPLSGQGASLALVGAYLLANELSGCSGDYHQAFVNYEKRLQPFVEANQALGQYTANSLLTGTGNSFEFEERQKLFEKASNAIEI